MKISKPDRSLLFKQMAAALGEGQISKQPVGMNANTGPIGKNDQSKVKNSIPDGVKMAQKGNANRSYTVSVINKAQARMGGH